MKKHFFIVILMLLGFISCDVAKTRIFTSFVTAYYNTNQLELETTESGNIVIIGTGGGWMCGWDSKGKQKQIYDSLCVLHNDISYNTELEYGLGASGPTYFKGDILSIEVFSNKDYDAQHPANASLNDIVRVMSISPYKHIASNYKEFYNWKRDFPAEFSNDSLLLQYRDLVYSFQSYKKDPPSEMYPVNKRLSEATASDFVLMELVDRYYKGGSPMAILMFEKAPDIAETHEVTVRISLSDGFACYPKIQISFE